jgi:hypothetical protein
MTESLWKYLTVGVATNKTVGDSLAAAIAFGPDDNKTFTRGTPLRLIGSESTTPVAWLAVVPLKQAAYDAVVEFNTPGPNFPLLNAAGLQDAQVLGAKVYVSALVGSREDILPQVASYVASLGYEVVPQAS